MPSRKRYKASKRSFKRTKPKKRTKSRKNLVKALDVVFSQYIRQKYLIGNYIRCYTCDRRNELKKMQNGHYVSRSVRSLRWNENNCRPQCYGCNVMQGGQPITFRERLVIELGEKEVKELEQKRHTLFKPTDQWLSEQITYYQNKLSLNN